MLVTLPVASHRLMAQQGFGTNAPASTAVVEMKSANKGVLFPRVSLNGLGDNQTIKSPAKYLLVFNTNKAGDQKGSVTPGFYYWNGSSWVRLACPDDVNPWRMTGNVSTLDGNYVGTTGDQDLVFKSNNVEAMRITKEGNIGIGTSVITSTSPTAGPDPSALMEVRSEKKGFALGIMRGSSTPPPDGALFGPNTDADYDLYNPGASDMEGFYFYKDGVAHSGLEPYAAVSVPLLGGKYTNFFNGERYVSSVSKYIYTGSKEIYSHGLGQSFSSNDNCNGRYISAGGCGGMSLVVGKSGYAYKLVEINGQCWFAEDLVEKPTNVPSWPTTLPIADVGSCGFYNVDNTAINAPWGTNRTMSGGWISFPTYEGVLYQWSAAMNGAHQERAQGLCPTGFHIPSDCEYMYLEHGYGMSIDQQKAWRGNDRSSGFVGNKVSRGTFDIAYAGCRSAADGTFRDRGQDSGYGNKWTSTEFDGTNAIFHEFKYNTAQVGRAADPKGVAYTVRCLKD